MILFEVRVKYVRQTGEDNPCVVKEAYLVNAVNCSDAEKKVLDHIRPMVFRGEIETPQIKKVQFYDWLLNNYMGHYYKAKVEQNTIVGDSEKRKAVNFLLAGDTIGDALNALRTLTKSIDCEIISIAKSPVVEVILNEEEGTEE